VLIDAEEIGTTGLGAPDLIAAEGTEKRTANAKVKKC